MTNLLEGKIVLVTGASKGIGKAIAIGYGAAGAAVACVARTRHLLAQTVHEIRQEGGEAIAIVADVTVETETQQMVQMTIEQFGKLDILVLNAGGNFDYASVADGDTASWRRTMELNLMGPYFCAKAAIPYLKENRSGKIITIGSGLGHRGIPERSAYACAKAGAWMLTRVLAQELAGDNISVNELIPGPVDTGTLSDDFRRVVVEKQGEWVKEPKDVVQLALFLAAQPDIGPTAQSFSLMRRDN